MYRILYIYIYTYLTYMYVDALRRCTYMYAWQQAGVCEHLIQIKHIGGARGQQADRIKLGSNRPHWGALWPPGLARGCPVAPQDDLLASPEGGPVHQCLTDLLT